MSLKRIKRNFQSIGPNFIPKSGPYERHHSKLIFLLYFRLVFSLLAGKIAHRMMCWHIPLNDIHYITLWSDNLLKTCTHKTCTRMQCVRSLHGTIWFVCWKMEKWNSNNLSSTKYKILILKKTEHTHKVTLNRISYKQKKMKTRKKKTSWIDRKDSIIIFYPAKWL